MYEGIFRYSNWNSRANMYTHTQNQAQWYASVVLGTLGGEIKMIS